MVVLLLGKTKKLSKRNFYICQVKFPIVHENKCIKKFRESIICSIKYRIVKISLSSILTQKNCIDYNPCVLIKIFT